MYILPKMKHLGSITHMEVMAAQEVIAVGISNLVDDSFLGIIAENPYNSKDKVRTLVRHRVESVIRGVLFDDYVFEQLPWRFWKHEWLGFEDHATDWLTDQLWRKHNGKS
jgi:hypothetical protein